MGKPFDATLKQLLDAFAADWVGWLGPRVGLPPAAAVEPLDVDLSTVQVAADKVFRLRPPASGLLHIEPQASWDGTLPDRLSLYNALLHDRYGGPVYSVALLLRREANAAALTGTLARAYPDGREYFRFAYSVVRVWELPAEPLLAGGFGAVPLALLTDEAEGRLAELVARIDDRMRAAGVPPATQQLLLTSSYILLGLRYDRDDIQSAFRGVPAMRESTTYMAILEEGEVKGRQADILAVLRRRFGTVASDIESRVRAVTDPARLQDVLLNAMEVAAPGDLRL